MDTMIKSRQDCLRESWIAPTLEEIRAIKQSAEWDKFSDDKKRMYNTVEEGLLHPKDRDANGEPIFDTAVARRVKLHGTFG